MHRSVVIFMCWWAAVLFAAAGPVAAEEVSPRQEVRENFQRLLETNACPGCDLSGAVMNRADLAGADLRGANLAGSKLYLANLAEADLRDANLQGAALGGADLAGADLTGANLTGAVLEGAYLKGARMEGRVETQRPYEAEGGPPVGELRYLAAEGASKDVPFTARPV
ncbi:MAG: pentapeptide repeat-containing protein, partial [Desulfobulbaceae bacterium]|nr:pentapeptide repeat-containing protein [Desulfobulbaceae bacterium]